MTYKANCQFRDLTDRHLYNAGDIFPHDGREINPARIEELSTDNNKAHAALITAFPDPAVETPTTKKKPRRRAAKTPRNGK